MHKHRILIVEDDTSLVQTLRVLLKRDYEVVTAEDGQIGFRVAQVAEPDLMIVDLLMPRMPGIEFCHAVKSIPKLQNIPIIVITGVISEEVEEEVKKIGAEVFLPKPFEMEDLLKHVHNLVKYLPRSDKKLSIYDLQGYE